MRSLGENIRSLRKANNISQKDLAKLLCITDSAVSQYEKNKRNPDINTLIKIADIMNVSTDYLLNRSGQFNDKEYIKSRLLSISQELEIFSEKL